MTRIVVLEHKPTRVESAVFDGTNAIDIAHWLNGKAYISVDGELVLHTLQGDIAPDIGDSVLLNPDAGVWPIKPEVRAALYDEVPS